MRRTRPCSDLFAKRQTRSAWRRRKSSCTRLAAACWPSAETTATPYAVPINYLYDEDAQEIIFHGSKVGHKVDALKRSDKVCFTVVSGESDALCKKFAMKYYPTEKMVDDEVAASGKAVQMFRISIDHISGKKVQER